MDILKRIFVLLISVIVLVFTYFYGESVVEDGIAYTPVWTKRIESPDMGKDGKKDINQATKYEIMKIKGFGEKYSKNITDYRNELGGFKGMDDLIGADGIGEKRLRTLKKYFRIGEYM